MLTQTEVTSQETIVDAKVSRAIKRHAGRLETFWGPTLYHLDDLPLRKDLSDLATVFTPFKQQVSPAVSIISGFTVSQWPACISEKCEFLVSGFSIQLKAFCIL